MPAFSQRNMFDVLSIQQGPDNEPEVEEMVIETTADSPSEPPTSAPGTPLSKSAKKRARKQAQTKSGQAAASSATNGKSEKPPKAAAKVAPSTAPAAANGGDLRPDERPSEPSKMNAATAAALEPPPPVKEKAPAKPKAQPRTKADSGAKEMSPPSTPSFKPAIPGFNPEHETPPTRKRKAPTDFTPAGPGQALTPASPSKNSVKFEDGILPGEGKDGEKTITLKKGEGAQDTVSAAGAPVPKKNQNAIERTVWTFIMIGGFITLLCMGHPYMIMLVLLCQTVVYKEISALFDLRDQGSKSLRPAGDWSKSLNWYFFVVTNYFLYGESIIYYFKHIVFVDAFFVPFAKNHRFISFMLYILGFVAFVANLQRQYLRQQFALFCWVHITLLLVVVSSHFIVNNILEGLIWFFVPASLVICNDIFAYICGKMFGRTPLIKLSPKKTVEGFVGAFICTLLFGLAWGTFFQQFNYMICPAKDLGVNVFSDIQCKPNPVFLWREYEFTGPIRALSEAILGHPPPSIWYKTYQIHVLFMATFASLIAPFGGFFASGFKRAFNIKDFGHSIPGHGGMTDRMDCQFMMGIFAYVYYSSLIRIQNVSVGSILQTVVVSLTTAEQLELYGDLKRYLEGQGVRTK